jgi:hypothetical protein
LQAIDIVFCFHFIGPHGVYYNPWLPGHFFNHRTYPSIKLTDHVIGFLNNVYPFPFPYYFLIIHWYNKYANNCWHCPSKGIMSKLKTRNGILIFMDQWSESVWLFIYLVFYVFFLEELLLILESFWK